MRRARVILLALVLCVTVQFSRTSDPAAMSLLGQDAVESLIEVGAGPVRERALEVVGRNRYDSATIELFGYLKAVIGLDSGVLFANSPPSVGGARFTYAGEIAVSSDVSRADVTELAGEGNLRVYFDDDAGANWDDPSSFADGEPVAEFSIRLRETVQRQAPGVGSVVGDADLMQEVAGEFAVGDERYRFGDAGIEQRLRTVGALIGDDAQQGVLFVALTGRTAVTDRPVNVVRLGGPGTPAPLATQPADDCANLEPWLTTTSENLAQAGAINPPFATDTDLASVDAQAVSQAATAINALAEAQRGSEAPAAGSDADRLVLTALSTYARGLETIATAAEDGDAALLNQGQSVVQDGARLLDRASDALEQLAGACAPE
jgi:hypothetical protein